MEIERLFQIIEAKLTIASVSGSLLFMLGEKSLPWHEKFMYLVIGTVAAYFTSSAAVLYFHLDAGIGGALAFFSGVIAIPISSALIGFAKDPKKLIDFIRECKKPSGGDNG